jgi:hypothetical protein
MTTLRTRRPVFQAACVLAAAGLLLTACGAPPPEPAPSAAPIPRPADRDQLAGLAAAAKDKRYVATYTLQTRDRPDRTVTAAVGTDGTWVVAVPAGVLSGLADVAIYYSPGGLFQCLLGPAAGTAGSRPDLGPLTPGCVQVTGLTPEIDPRVQHLFTDWIDPLVDRATALSVAAVPAFEGAQGSCFSVESNSAALAPPVDPGVYCFTPDGLLTAARVSFGTLRLAGPVAAAPPSVTMPAPLVTRDPVPVTAPPPPPPPPPPSTTPPS